MLTVQNLVVSAWPIKDNCSSPFFIPLSTILDSGSLLSTNSRKCLFEKTRLYKHKNSTKNAFLESADCYSMTHLTVFSRSLLSYVLARLYCTVVRKCSWSARVVWVTSSASALRTKLSILCDLFNLSLLSLCCNCDRGASHTPDACKALASCILHLWNAILLKRQRNILGKTTVQPEL